MPKIPKRKSLVWDHFDETEKGKKAKCFYCPQIISISGGSLSNLGRHIRKKHPSLLFFSPTQEVVNIDQYSHEFMEQAMDIYRDSPCLWNTESPDFMDGEKKAKAYEYLVTKFKEVDPKANRDTVIRVFRHIRSCYRKEMKKIKEFSSTASENDIFTSELWYFEKLNFLQELEMNRLANGDDNDEDMLEGPEVVMVQSFAGKCNTSPPHQKQISVKNTKPEFDNVHDLLGQCMLNHPHQSPAPDKYDYLLKVWAMTLRSLERDQQIYAEKLIGEVLCEAQFGSLSRDSALVTRVTVNESCL